MDDKKKRTSDKKKKKKKEQSSSIPIITSIEDLPLLESDRSHNIPEKDELPSYLKESWKKTKNNWNNFRQALIDDITHPKKAIKELVQSKQFITNSLAFLMGIIGALAAWGFEWLSKGAQFILTDNLFLLMNDNFRGWRFLAVLITPLLAACITAPLIWRFAPEAKGSGIPFVMESIVYRDGRMRHRTPFIKMFTSAISTGGGLSVGREGPITQIGAGFSSGIAHLFGLHGRKMKIVVISGLSAAIAATFNSPIGGALFGIEILLVSLIADEIVPIVIASLTASTISALIDIFSPTGAGIPEPSFSVDVLRELDWNSFIFDMHWFVVFGIFAGIIGVLYAKFFHFIRAIFDRLPVHDVAVPIIGAFLVGLTAIISPRNGLNIPLVFGAGYSTIEKILGNDSDLLTTTSFQSIILFLIVLLLLKLLCTSFSVGSGNPGGIFAPALFIGVCTGSLFANMINNINSVNVNVSVFALAGLASVFAGATRAPLTMIFMGSEMTGNIILVIPLMLTCSISYLICRGFLKESIYTQSLADKGLKLTLGGNVTILCSTTVEEVMQRDVTTIKSSATMKEAARLIDSVKPFSLPVVDKRKKLVGLITLSDVKRAIMEDNLEKSVLEYSPKKVIVLTADESVDEALDILRRAGIKRAPVIETSANPRLIGLLTQNDIFRCFELEKIKYIKDEAITEKQQNNSNKKD